MDRGKTQSTQRVREGRRDFQDGFLIDIELEVVI
jgi:hypothetical protein